VSLVSRRPIGDNGAAAFLQDQRGENALLRECARTTMDSGSAVRIRRLVARPLDWGLVLSSAKDHGLSSLLASHLDGLDGVPVSVQEKLRTRLRQNTLRNVALAGELVRLLARLRDGGVTAVPFKGPVLAAVAYGHLGLREFTDLDLLVKAEDVPAARRVLVADGYRPWFDLTAAQESAYVRSRYEHPFQRDTDGLIVEIQWRVVPAHFGVRLDYEGIWKRCEQSSLAGRQVPSLSAEDLLLVLAVHGTKHLWERLGWVTDIAELLRSHPRLDWVRLWKQAETSRSGRMLAVALRLAVELLDAPVPAGALMRATADPRVRFLVDEVERNLSMPRTSLWREGRFHIRAHERRADRWRYLVRFVLGTTPGDWAVVRLPRPLFPLYRVVRLVRIAVKYGRYATRSLARPGARS